ncbi:MAG TPA: hypothetical protein ENG68_01320 [bacterium]|nr:hypothetical protein [bacterium]
MRRKFLFVPLIICFAGLVWFIHNYKSEKDPYRQFFTGHICDCWRKVHIPMVKDSLPFGGVLPRANFVDKDLVYVIDITDMPVEMKFLARTFVGLANRSRAPKFIIADRKDPWYKYMISRIKNKKWYDETDLFSLIKEYAEKKVIKGAILYDPDLWNPAKRVSQPRDILNVVRTLCGIENAVAVTPGINNKLKLPVIVDTVRKRGWRGSATMSYPVYQWAFNNLWRRCYHHVIAYIPPLGIDNEGSGLTDYIVQFKLFCFYLPDEDKRTEKLFEYIFSKVPVNTAVIGHLTLREGWEGKIDRIRIIRIMSKFGKFFIEGSRLSNISYYSGIRGRERDKFSQKKIRFGRLNPDKIYITFCLTTENSADYCIIERLKHWKSPYRGKVPVGWAFPVLLSDLCPMVLKYYYDTATPNDYFIADTSGIGYIYPDIYGKIYTNQDEVWKEYLGMTNDYMHFADVKFLWCIGNDEVSERRFISDLSDLKALFYGMDGASRYLTTSFYSVDNKPVFHAYFPVKGKIDFEKIKSKLPATGPAFVFIGIDERQYTGQDILSKLYRFAKFLPKKYSVVRPDEFFYLYEKAKSKGIIRERFPEIKYGVKKEIVVRRVTRSINIDGNLSEWSDVKPILLNKREQIKWGKDRWGGIQDLSGMVWILRDDKYLYVGIKVMDQKISINRKNPLYGDCVEIYVDTRKGRFREPSPSEGFYRYILLPGMRGGGDRYLFMVYPTFDVGLVTRGWGGVGGKVYSKIIKGGYTIEARIPLLNFQGYPYTKPLGKELFFDISINDKDEVIKSKIFWEGSIFESPGILLGKIILQ